LFRNVASVENGFTRRIELDGLANRDDYRADNLLANLVFGTPDQVITKLKAYEAAGVDIFGFNGSFAQPMAEQKKSLCLFIDEVMPAFAATAHHATGRKRQAAGT